MYHETRFTTGTDAFVEQIATASAAQRLDMLPELTRMVESMKRSGTRVPTHLRNLHEQLLDEAIEARFDNLPV